MTSSTQYELVMQLNQLATNCGFYVKHDFDQLVLQANRDKLPVYAENITIARGSVEDLLHFLYGWLKFREYVLALKVVKPETIAKKEKDIRNRELLKIIKGNENDTTLF